MYAVRIQYNMNKTTQKNPCVQEKLKGLQTKDGKIKPEDIYTSCSECGYQSACGSYCSYSLPGIIIIIIYTSCSECGYQSACGSYCFILYQV